MREPARALHFLHFCKNFVRKADTNKGNVLVSYGAGEMKIVDIAMKGNMSLLVYGIILMIQ